MSLNQIALLSVHTSPLDQPGVGDAGGLNVYVVETAKRLAQQNIGVIFSLDGLQVLLKMNQFYLME